MRSQSTSRSNRRQQRRGVSAVEMALAAPLLFFIVLGLIEISHAFMIEHLMLDAARQACRAAVCPHSTNTAVTNAANQLLRAEGVTAANVTVLVNNSAGDLSQAQASDNVTVQVSIAASDVSMIPGGGYLMGTLTASFTLRHE